MEKKLLFKDTNAYIFDELEGYMTIVFTIERGNKIYIIDTFMGSTYMEVIKEEYPKDKEWIVINTHYHYDHIFGNAAFANNKIYAHQKCYDLINKTWNKTITNYGEQLLGIKKKTLPNSLFEKQLNFDNDDIILFYTPGHSIDSISIYDDRNKAIYTGDNLEKPMIQLTEDNINQYINTLQIYLSYESYRYFASHTLELSKEDIEATINYLKNIDTYSFSEKVLKKIHQSNLKIIS